MLAVVALVAGLTVAGTPAYAEDGAPAQVNLVLDVSGSMEEPASDGVTKIQAARSAIRTAVAALPDVAHVGMRTFGGCGRSTPVVPVARLDRGKITGAADAVRPGGDTPLAYALERAGADFTGVSTEKSIVLVSDGRETCGGDPVAAARTLAAECVGVHVDVVGLRVDAQTAQQLREVAAAGCGQYLDAADSATLENRLNRLTLRAMRQPRAVGTPVTGTDTREAAPAIAPGLYRDVLPAAARAKRYWAFDLPAGATVHIGASIAQSFPLGQTITYDGFDLSLRDVKGASCATTPANHIRSGGTSHHGGAHIATASLRKAVGRAGSCAEPGRWVIEVVNAHQDRTRPVPFELSLRLTPTVDDVAGLPPAYVDNTMDPPAMTVGGAPVAVDGSPSFGDAPITSPGVYADRVRAGEEVFYRVPVTWGQQLLARIRVSDAPDNVKSVLKDNWRTLWLLPYSPRRAQVDLEPSQINKSYDGDAVELTVVTAPVRYRNSESSSTVSRDKIQSADTPGYYYLGVYFEADEADNLIDVAFELDVQVVGDRSGAPTYADTPGATDPELEIVSVTGDADESHAGRDAPVPMAVWIAGGGGLALVVLGLATAVLLRRRTRM